MIPASLPTDYQIINGYLIGPDVNLSFVNLPGADLTGADLTDAYLFGITWSNTRCPNGVVQSTQCPRTAAG